MQKLIEFFERKKWSQMFQKYLIRREMAKKETSAENGGFRRERRFQPPKPKIGMCYHKAQLLSGITFTVSFKIKPVIQIYANVSDPPPPLFLY